MPLSNTTQNILRSSPYWDDFTRSKRYHRVLIKPKTPVQTRELNQIQSMLQNQVEQVTSSIYREGAAISGGQQALSNNTVVLQVVRNDNVDIRNFYNAETTVGAIAEGQSSGARAIVTQIALQPSSPYAAILFAPLNALQFEAGESVAFLNPTTGSEIATLVVAPGAAATNVASTFSVTDGVFYLRGHMVDVPRQTVILQLGTTAPSKRVGFTVSESIVTSATDATLLDPALGATNYAAPGADRLKLSAILTAKDINDDRIAPNSDEGFIELVRIIDGVIQPKSDRLESDFIEDTLARRTNDESGDYVVKPFRLLVKEHNPPLNVPNITGRVTGNASSNTVQAANVITTITLANGFVCDVTTLFDSEVTVGDVLVVNGESRKVTSIVSNTALRVNNAYTQDFTNATATVVSGQKLNVELEAGKAYVRGYEIETTGTLKLTAPRARTTQNVNNGKVATSFGPYVYVTHNRGLFNINQLELADLHCTPYSNINFNAANSTSGAYFSSKIGTARARSFVYHTGVGDTDTVYKLYLVDASFLTKTFAVNTTPNAADDTRLSANGTPAVVINTAGRTIKLRQNATSTANATLSAVNDAYIGATIRLYTRTGSRLQYSITDSANTVVSGNAVEQTLTLAADDNLQYVNTTANIEIIFSDKCIRSITSAGNVANVGMTTSIFSKVNRTDSGNTVVFGTNATSLLFKYREGIVKPSTITDENFEVLRYFGSVSGSESPGGSGNIVFTISPSTVSIGQTEAPYPLGTDTEHQYLVATLSSNGCVVPLENANAAVSLVLRELDLGIPQSNIAGTPTSTTINLYTRMNISSAHPRTKTIYNANTNLTSVTVNSIGCLVPDLNQYKGHIAINSINSTSDRVVGLGVADVYEIEKVYAVKDANNIATDAAAVVDVTDNYMLDTGQRDWAYLHSSIALKPGRAHYTIGASQMLVMVNRFEHSPDSVGLSYFTPQSYTGIELENIPAFTDPKTGENYRLANFVDFRPVQSQNVAAANTATNPYLTPSAVTFPTTVLPHPSAAYQADYEYYLPRIDKVVLTKNREFRIISGTPSPSPTIPADDPDGITLYVLSFPAYTAYPELVNVRPFEYRRYTMKDIRRLEKRIESLEYHAALSTMDIQALNSPEYGDDNLERDKNGILTDNFSTDGVVSYSNLDTKISLDHRKQEMRPRATVRAYNMEPDVANISNIMRFGGADSQLLSLPYTSVPFITQGLASKSININPFNVFSWIGNVTLFPSSDTWIDEITKPDVVTNLFNENDGVRDAGTIETAYNYWETSVVGIDEQKSLFNSYLLASNPNNANPEDQWQINDGQFQELEGRLITTNSQGTRSAETVFTHTKVSSLVQESGNRTVDASIAPKMRGQNIDIAASGLLPAATIRATFDEIDVTSYVERANRITIDVDDADTFMVGDTITTFDGGRGRIVGIVSDIANDVAYLYIVDAQGSFASSIIQSRVNATRLVPLTTIDVTVQAYEHWHGKITAVTSNTDTSSGPWIFTLDTGAPTASDSYTGKVMHFSDGGSIRRVNLLTGESVVETSGVAGCKTIITAYDPASRQVTVTNVPLEFLEAIVSQKNSPTIWNPIRYSIGELETTAQGSINEEGGEEDIVATITTGISPGSFYGMFRLPGMRTPTDDLASSKRYDRIQSSALQFNVGTRVFRLQNDGSTNIATSAAAGYAAQGSTIVNELSIIRTRPVNNWQTLSGASLVRNTDASQVLRNVRNVSYLDPLAQTFIVEGDKYPYGVFITHLDLFFASKGATGMDVVVELRPTVNGYPSPNQVLATAKLSAGDINVVPSGAVPSPGNATHYTRFTFDTPSYLAPNVEYCVAILSNSNEYEVFVGGIGERLLGSNRIISEQPHGGVLFKSQNARTATPEPLEDLMFVLHRADFEMRESNAVFQLANSYHTLINNTTFDAAFVNFDYLDFLPTSPYTKFYLSTTDQSNVVRTVPISNRTHVELSDRMAVVDNSADALRVYTTLRTSNSHISPILDTQRTGVLLIKNLIDNGQLYANGFAFTAGTPNTSASAAYSTNGNAYALTITDGNGTGAQFYAVTNTSGYIVRIARAAETVFSGATPFTSNGGYDYTETPTVTWASNTHFTVQPTFSYVGETSAASRITGEQKARYITRTISLADGFDAGDLKVYLSAVRAPQHDIDVYYKVLATGDPQRFDEKQWTRMVLREDLTTVYSATATERKEYEYRTADDTASYVSNGVTFNRFHSFAIKIVLRSQNASNPYLPDTVIVPKISNLRILALDE